MGEKKKYTVSVQFTINVESTSAGEAVADAIIQSGLYSRPSVRNLNCSTGLDWEEIAGIDTTAQQEAVPATPQQDVADMEVVAEDTTITDPGIFI